MSSKQDYNQRQNQRVNKKFDSCIFKLPINSSKNIYKDYLKTVQFNWNQNLFNYLFLLSSYNFLPSLLLPRLVKNLSFFQT